MAFTNLETREIHCKVLFLGPKGSGKTTNFQDIYKQTTLKHDQHKLTIEPEESPFFEFLPISLGYLRDFHVKLHLYTVSLSPLYTSVFPVLLKGVDGLVFVFDGSLEAMMDNRNELQEAKDLLARHGHNFATLAKVIQFNKRDHEASLPIEILRRELNSAGLADVEAVAKRSIGTMETIQAIGKQILDQLARETEGS